MANMQPSTSFNMAGILQVFVPLAVLGAIAAKWCIDRMSDKVPSETSNDTGEWDSLGHHESDHTGDGHDN